MGLLLMTLMLLLLPLLTEQLTPTTRSSEEPQLVVVTGLSGSGTRAVRACHPRETTRGEGFVHPQCTKP